MFILVMKIIYFRGDLTDVSAKTATLHAICAPAATVNNIQPIHGSVTSKIIYLVVQNKVVSMKAFQMN